MIYSPFFSETRDTTGIRSIAYYPVLNGLLGRFHHQLKACFHTYGDREWCGTLFVVLFRFRVTIKASFQCFASYRVLDIRLQLPEEAIGLWRPDSFIV